MPVMAAFNGGGMPFITDKLAHSGHRTALSPESTNKNTFLSRFTFNPEAIMTQLKTHLVGQDAAMDEIEKMLWGVKAGIGDPEKPLTVNLLLGPTGVGKTETVRRIAWGIYGNSDAFCRIDMNTLAQEHYVAALTGAPPGYVGSKEGTTLFESEKIEGSYSRPGIVLFDELEKASKEVIRSLLNVLDNGRLILSNGNKTIDFRNSLIFMTSNIGASEVAEQRLRYQHRWKRWWRTTNEQTLIERALTRHFDPEFLNRIDRKLVYRSISAEHVPSLIQLELARIQRRLSIYGITINLTPAAEVVLMKSYDSRYGARELARAFRTLLEPPLAKALLTSPQQRHFIIDGVNAGLQIVNNEQAVQR
ncbi:TPA: ATP-dependent Clp protease ATP-binding subunit [Citrobacter freundii]|nr:AAA family ATPase [Enterobacter ludwigii]ELP5236134.1 ATP-dependent Clp protease ATP-binding subunit [Citrobacter freundii]HED1905558.1 ATP-dependent Clp protease ATP-binding subunit [Citrobacter farmeri]ELT0895122.1 ATP-dependent Clp protease ATP-binding subunit [Citrobacter freundii]HED2376146.1 ATP-dependent Clp protease ATP-binding subunit [Citrobacter freundii]HED3840487.1 ATP-dependent Clp protease ATP-binding subunit [Citrobacter freundii]